MVVLDRHGHVTALNPEAEHFFGWAELELLGEPMSRLIPVRFHRLLDTELEIAGGCPAASSAPGTVSCFARHRDGSEFPVELTRRSFGNALESRSLLTVRDLTQWRRAQETRSRNNQQARDAIESIGDAVITTDAFSRISYLNPMAEHLTGWSSKEALGQALDTVLPLIAEASRLPVPNTAARCLKEGRSVDLEDGVLLLRRDGTEVPVGDSAAPIRDRTGVTIGAVLVIQDESEKRRVGHRLSYEASHDGLTGLINRREFERRLALVVAELSSVEAEHILLSLDLDRFKVVNDSCGHDAGDALLRSLGPLLSQQLRKHDTLARLGGDEFGILLANCPLVEAERIAENIRLELSRYRFEWAAQHFSIGVSIGLIRVTETHGEIGSVLRLADAACYQAKAGGGDRVYFDRAGEAKYDPSQVLTRPYTRLARAIDGGHFELYAQPIVALQPEIPDRPRYEILLRLPDGHGRVQKAADFLPQAARYNLLPAIDQWVVCQTIALLGRWRRENPGAVLPVMQINLSPSALADDSLVGIIEEQLAKHDLPPQAICFELAESAALANQSRTLRFLTGVRSAGCGIALEDFGGGLTSLAYLRTLPVDFLKIGGPFIGEIVEDPVFGSIVSAVNQIGRSLGITTIAKQVGSENALRLLRALGIGYAQGLALTPPMPLLDEEGQFSMPIHLLQQSA